MPRRFFSRILPSRHSLEERWYLRPFWALSHDPALWSPHRKGILGGLAIGLFFSFMPFMGQPVAAAFLAIYLRRNLPMAVAVTFLGNPLTFGPIFFFNYKVGAAVLAIPRQPWPEEFSFGWLTSQLIKVWGPLLTGWLVVGGTVALIGYVILNQIWVLSLRYRYRNRRRNNRGPLPPK